MDDEFLIDLRKRMTEHTPHDELLDDALERVGRKVREAFKIVAQEARSLSDVSVAAGNIVAHALAEQDIRWHAQAALQWNAWMCLLKQLPDEARRSVERELKTVTFDDLLP